MVLYRTEIDLLVTAELYCFSTGLEQDRGESQLSGSGRHASLGGWRGVEGVQVSLKLWMVEELNNGRITTCPVNRQTERIVLELKQKAFPLITSDARVSPLCVDEKSGAETKEHAGRIMMALKKYGGSEKVREARRK